MAKKRINKNYRFPEAKNTIINKNIKLITEPAFLPNTIKQDGTRVNEPSYLIGADLTENQIAILFSEMLL